MDSSLLAIWSSFVDKTDDPAQELPQAWILNLHSVHTWSPKTTFAYSSFTCANGTYQREELQQHLLDLIPGQVFNLLQQNQEYLKAKCAEEITDPRLVLPAGQCEEDRRPWINCGTMEMNTDHWEDIEDVREKRVGEQIKSLE